MAARCASLGFSASGHLGGDLALVLGDQRPVGLHHVERGEQPPVGRDQLEEIGGEPVDADLVEHRRERARLLVGGKHRAAQQPRQVGDLRHQRVEPVEIDLDRVDGILLERKLEQRGRIAARHAGYDCLFACHVASALSAIPQARHRRGRWAPSH